jgi:ABC-type antimicrobial peptide transport system permease subunit
VYDQDGLSPLNGILGFDLRHAVVPMPPDFVLTSGRMLRARDIGTRNVVVDAATENAPLRLRLGDQVTVRYLDKRSFISGEGPSGPGISCTIVGFYRNNTGIPSLQDTLLGDYATVDAIGGSNAFYQLAIHVDPRSADALLTRLQTELPSGQVFVRSYVDVFAQVQNLLNNLILLLEAIVLPALLAAAVNIANAVALAMLDRRRELAIQKALGHTSQHLLGQIMLEQVVAALVPSLIALLLAAGLGLAVAQVIYTGGSGGGGSLSIATMVGIIVASILLGMLITLLVSWGATHRRPLEALRYQ